jgi:hypothetical protein
VSAPDAPLELAITEVDEAKSKGWTASSVGDALAHQLERADQVREAGFDPTKIPFEEHAAVLNGSAKPPEEARLRLVEDGERSHSWKPIDLLAFVNAPPEPPSIGGLVYPGRRHVFSGEPETLKTWGALVLAAEEIQAEHEVVYVDFEMGAREHAARLRALGLDDEQIARFLYIAPSEPMTDSGIAADVESLLGERGRDLLPNRRSAVPGFGVSRRLD